MTGNRAGWAEAESGNKVTRTGQKKEPSVATDRCEVIGEAYGDVWRCIHPKGHDGSHQALVIV